MDATGWLADRLERAERAAWLGGLLGAAVAPMAGWLAEWALGTDPFWFLSPPHWPTSMTAGGLAGTICGLELHRRRLNSLLRKTERD